jgi:hypothetical protein
MTVKDVTADVCKGGCGGIWFDNFELRKFDEPHESAGQALLQVEKNPDVRVDHGQKRNCPKCQDLVMMRHFFSVKRQVEIDECPGCAGIWLDYGELGQIRSQFASEREREQAAEEYFRDVLGPDLAEMKVRSELRASSRIADIFGFLSPWGRRRW